MESDNNEDEGSQGDSEDNGEEGSDEGSQEGSDEGEEVEGEEVEDVSGEEVSGDEEGDWSDEEESEMEVEEKVESEIGSSDLESEEEGDPHGFMYAHNLDTYKRSKRERIEESNANKDSKEVFKEKFRKKEKKGGGESNKQKLKHKPFMMVQSKKIKTLNQQYETTKSRLKKMKVQLGKFKKNTKQKIDSKKKNMRLR